MIITAILKSSLIFAIDTQAFACSYVGPRPPAQMMQESDAVFSGFVIAASNADATFSIENAWKGVSEEVVTLLSGPGDCSYIALK
ncbi:hypothetical protein [Candidatus Nitrososphaera gargensis]|uniref:hypothetical protein n=1 Tax=Candidatus Nitrososphaera gargensis TaxID=497727 RepID=UPI0011E50785|nr:hypothetical protein [Candidatus Nitrososphaera gargensis]